MVIKLVHKLIAHYHASSIYDIDPDFFLSLGVSTVFVSLDNSLENYNVDKPSSKAYELRDELKNRGISLIIYSFKKSNRAIEYAKMLETQFMGGRKLSKTIKKYLEINGIDSNVLVFVGASIYKDCRLALKVGTQMILTDFLPGKLSAMNKFDIFKERIARNKAIRNKTNGRKVPNKTSEVI